MNSEIEHLPSDTAELQSLVRELLIKQKNISFDNETLEKLKHTHENELKEERIKYRLLEEKYQVLQKRFFGRKSEKLSHDNPDQLRLFNEAEESAGTEGKGDTEEEDSSVVIKSYTRRKSGRRPLDENLPREEVVHDCTDEEKKCPCCGEERPRIGEDVTEELDIIPAQIKVIKHVRPKYGPCSCDDFLHEKVPEIATGAMPPRLIPHSIASAGLIAYIVTSKFADALPFYRQSKIFSRINVDISRATLSNWTIRAAEQCENLIPLLKDAIRGGPLIQMDETVVQVLHEEGRAPQNKSYMWAAVGYPASGKKLVLFEYHPGRSGEIPQEILTGYLGYLQTDGYAGYNKSGGLSGITHVGCFAHARRKFTEALTADKKSKNARKALMFIQKLYKIENGLRSQNISSEEFVAKREKESQPVLDEFHAWLSVKCDEILPGSKIGRAIRYTLNEWDKLVRYLEAEILTPDNNRVENAIRPFVVGRKNWLFSNTPRGARSSALMYSLVESAKANGLDPYRYLRYLFTHLPAASTDEERIRLLPHVVDAERLLNG